MRCLKPFKPCLKQVWMNSNVQFTLNKQTLVRTEQILTSVISDVSPKPPIPLYFTYNYGV